MSTKEELIDILLGSRGSGPAAPIYFASTHGIYDIINGPVESFTVPPNTYIFEASSIGEATLTTIDHPLWEMIQNRDEFAAYLYSSGSAKDPLKKQVIKNLCYYKPGDTIYKRTLILEPENQYDYAWGYYKFSLGDPVVTFPESTKQEEGKPIIVPAEPSNPPYTDVMKTFRLEHFPPAKTRLRGFERIDTGSDMRFINETKKRDDIKGPAIFIFSSCASFWKSDDEKRNAESIINIGRAQQQANLNFADMGFTSGLISGENHMPVLLGPNSRNVKLRIAKGKSVIEGFSKASPLRGNLELTSVDKDELTYLEKVGSEVTRFVRPRYKAIQTSPGSASIFIKSGEGRYDIAKSPSGKTWWTPEEIVGGIDKGSELYIYIGGDWIMLTKKAGIYTAALRQMPIKKKFGSNWLGGAIDGSIRPRKTRRFLKKSKKFFRKKTRKTL